MKNVLTFSPLIFALILSGCGSSGDGDSVNNAPTASNVSITDNNGGNAVVGDGLTGNYIYADVEGDAEGATAFRWLRNGIAINDATNATYTLVAVDSGQFITFVVMPVAATGTITGSAVTSSSIVVLNSPPVALNFPPTADNVSITDNNGGNAVVGDGLTGNYIYADVEGDAEGATAFRWLRNGIAINGATASTYILITNDIGQSITFEVTPVAVTGEIIGSAVTSIAIVVINSAPTVSGVSITDDNGGKVVVGDNLTGNYTYADWEGDFEGATTFRWLRNGASISGATASSYTLVAADSGQSITFEVTPVAATGTAIGSIVTSSAMVVNSAPIASNVSISDDNGGSALVGDNLTGSYTYTDVDGDAEGATTFRWLRNGTAISGATVSTYTLVADDSGQSITFEVTPVAVTGEIIGSAVVASSAIVVNSAPTVSGVSITDDNGGSALVGDNLTGSYTYTDVDGDAEGATTFRWLRNGTAISGATVSTYTLVADDSGQSITFEVTPVAVTGEIIGSAVTSSVIAIINSAPTVSSVSITDDNAGNALVGDNLTGNYIYADVDGDAEGGTTFRWLRNGMAISGATTSKYTLILEDVPTRITFEVTPVAVVGVATGNTITSTVLETGTPPVVSGLARYLDVNTNGVNDAGDQLIVPFDQNVIVNTATGSDFNLPVSGDSLGTGASISSGSASNEITITLGVSPNLKSRHLYAGDTIINSPSGIDVSGSMMPDAIEGVSGVDAQESVPIDVIPGYVDSLQSLGKNDSFSVALGDVDDDGDLDMVVANLNQGNRVYINDGTGSYTDTNQSLGTNYSWSIDLGDIDGDGDLDMVVANVNESNQVYTNDGTGTFSDTNQVVGTNSQSHHVVLGDVDNDGDLDMVVANNSSSNKVYINDGFGVFTDSNQSLGTNGSKDIALEDIDSDGDLDMVVVNDHGEGNRVYKNDGSGVFSDTGQSLGDSHSWAVDLGDIDGDGDLDMVVANQSQGINDEPDRVYINNGTGVFTDTGQSLGLGTNEGSFSVALGDIDDDGDLDLVVGNLYGATNRVYTNDGAGIFTDLLLPLGASDSPSVVLGDVDGDGDLDMVAANYSFQGNQVYLNSLSGTWGSSSYSDFYQSLGTSESESITLGDIDGDGDLDMVVANYGQGNRIYSNDGMGVYTDTGQSLGVNNSNHTVLGDVDGDGDLDMVVANTSQGNRVYANDGAGNFTDSTQSLGGTNNSLSVALGDVDDDGDLDMVVVNGNQGNRVYTNDGAGNFTDSTQSLGTNTSRSVALGDVDSDGDLDMVVANYGQGERVYTNDGAGNFTDSTQSLGGTNNSLSVALGDVDSDGDLDMIVTYDTGDGNRVYTNNGMGVFTDTGQSLGMNNSWSIAIGDMDGDGDLDMVVANAPLGELVYTNDGMGVFTTGQLLGNPTNGHSVALGDVDGDGDLDMVVGIVANTANRVYLNQ